MRGLLNLNKRVMAGLAIVCLIVVGISGLIFRSISQLVASSEWVAHSYEVIDTLDLTEAYFADAQSAERGYVATCKKELIAPFRRDIPLIYSRVAALRTLTQDNPAQQKRIAALTAALNAELAQMTSVIDVTLKGNVKTAESMLTDERSTRAADGILATVKAMENEERRLLRDRLAAVKTFATLTLITSAAGTAACFSILALLFWLIRRESLRRAETEASLQDANARLEGSLVELNQHNAAARTIGLLAELLQTCRSTKEALSIAASHLRTILPGAAGSIGLFSNSRDVVETIQTLGDGAAETGEFPPDSCWSLRRGRAHLSEAGRSGPCCSHLPDDGRTVLCLPMIAQGETLGVLSIGLDRTLTEIERQTVQTITEQLALAVANLKLQETLRFQSLRDQLTGLYNRRYLDDALTRELARAKRHNRPIAVVMMDVDHFKRFNDTYGHDGGDALLAEFGKLLAAQARGEDIACRYGGEEFCLILPGASAAAAASRAEEIREAAKALRVHSRGRPLGAVTMSAGVAAFPVNGETGDGIIAAADVALYRAKNDGRDRVAVAAEPEVPGFHAATAS